MSTEQSTTSNPTSNPIANPVANTTLPRETLQGDRLCMQCLHPLRGRAIERDAGTGLLYVRCGECATASALFEYPTATPWLNRAKSVIASTLAVTAIITMLALGGITGGFMAGASSEACDVASFELAMAFRSSLDEQTKADPQIQSGNWTATYDQWLASPAGQDALANARFSVTTLVPFVLLTALGTAIATPFALFAGIALTRQGLLRRMVYAALPVALAAIVVWSLYSALGFRFPVNSWQQVAIDHYLAGYTALSTAWFLAFVAASSAAAPSIAAFIARTILPPRDRRLVAWLWEWRGKTVPRD